jgi:uncharacterized protein involved in tolerance to divalent cations
LTNNFVFLPVVILFCLDQQLCVPSSCDLVLSWPTTLCSFQLWSCYTKLLVKKEQDHNWKEHKVVGQDKTRSPLEGTQSCWSRQNKITTGRNTKWLVKTEQDHNRKVDQQLCVPSSSDILRLIVLSWPTTLCSFQLWSCWVKTEQDHHWKEHRVVGQDRTRSPLEGTQSYWSRQNKITTGRNTKWLIKTEQDHNWKEFCLDQQLCVPSSSDILRLIVLSWPTTLCSFQLWSCCLDQ